MKHVSWCGLEHRARLQAALQGARAQQLLGAGTKAASPLDATAAHSTAAGSAFGSCTEGEHAQRAVSSVTALQAE